MIRACKPAQTRPAGVTRDAERHGTVKAPGRRRRPGGPTGAAARSLDRTGALRSKSRSARANPPKLGPRGFQAMPSDMARSPRRDADVARSARPAPPRDHLIARAALGNGAEITLSGCRGRAGSRATFPPSPSRRDRNRRDRAGRAARYAIDGVTVGAPVGAAPPRPAPPSLPPSSSSS